MRSTPAKQTDDARFRYRVKLDAPRSGTEAMGDELRLRLDAALGRGKYAIHPVRWDRSKLGQPLAIHCDDIAPIPDIVKWWDAIGWKRQW